MVKTHKDYLVENHGLKPEFNPVVVCPCGRETAADCMVDLVPLDMRVRKALGLYGVEFICDGCQTRLFRDRHISEAEFYGLLGATPEGLISHSKRDAEWQLGVDLRHEAHKPRHERVTFEKIKSHADHTTVPVIAPIPLQDRERTHQQQAQWLAYRYNLTNIIQPPPVPRG